MQSIALIAGPSVGGLIVAGLHRNVALYINAVTFVISTLTLLRMSLRRPDPADAAGEPTGSAGWSTVLRFVAGSPLLKMSLLVTVVVNLAYAGLTEVALPSFAISPLNSGAHGFGLIMAGFGVGSLLGALAGSRLLAHPRRGLLALIFGVTQGAAVVCVPLGSSLAVAVTGMLLTAAVQAALNVFFLTMLQTHTPANLLGRVMSLLVTSAGLAFPISTLLAGVAVRDSGAATVIVAAGIGISLAFATGIISRTYRRL